jgi:hypothetical protein
MYTGFLFIASLLLFLSGLITGLVDILRHGKKSNLEPSMSGHGIFRVVRPKILQYLFSREQNVFKYQKTARFLMIFSILFFIILTILANVL